MINKCDYKKWRKNWKTKKTGKQLSLNLSGAITTQNEIIELAISKAYAPSIQNTAIKIYKYGSKKLSTPKSYCKDLLFEKLTELFSKQNSISEKDFIDWEEELAKEMQEIYKQNGIGKYTLGNAQKWINMSIKYIFSSNYFNRNCKLFEVCFLPIDSIIQNIAYKDLAVPKLSEPWSKCDCWNDIKEYQENIKDAIVKRTSFGSRLWWECNAWK